MFSPDPGSDEHSTLDPYVFVRPYSNSQPVTSPPWGFAVAFNVAETSVTDEAAPVTTRGAPNGTSVGATLQEGFRPEQSIWPLDSTAHVCG